MNDKVLITQKDIETKIYTIRGVQVMLDGDLAEMYQTETKYINRAVKRNQNRFPIEFAFQLNEEEWTILKFQLGTSSSHGGRRTLPHVFTEQGVAMLSAVLQTPIAVEISVKIMQVFTQMQKLMNINFGIMQRIDGLERKQIKTEENFKKVFKTLYNTSLPTQGIFFEGQIFDAYELNSKLIRSAKKSIVLIDNYMDESTLLHLAKKKRHVKVQLLCKKANEQFRLDLRKVNEQYGDFEIKLFDKSHDRFLIIDGENIYHLGASLKDLGKRWFAFSKMEKTSVQSILEEIKLL